MEFSFDNLELLYKETSPGLFYGNTALGLYLSLRDRSFSSSVIKDVINYTGSHCNNISLESGLLGLTPTIDWIYKRISGKHLTAFLEESDSAIYRKVGYNMDTTAADIEMACNVSLYISYRLSMAPPTVTIAKIWHRLLNQLNEIIFRALTTISGTSYQFSLKYAPAFYLLCLIASFDTGVNKELWKKKIEVILPCIITKFPFSPANRLYYYLVVNRLRKILRIEDSRLNDYLKILYNSTSSTEIISELKNSIYWGTGICGGYIILRADSCFHQKHKQISNEIKNIIQRSTEFLNLQTNRPYLKKHLGLWDGIGGIMLTELLMRRDSIRHER